MTCVWRFNGIASCFSFRQTGVMPFGFLRANQVLGQRDGHRGPRKLAAAWSETFGGYRAILVQWLRLPSICLWLSSHWAVGCPIRAEHQFEDTPIAAYGDLHFGSSMRPRFWQFALGMTGRYLPIAERRLSERRILTGCAKSDSGSRLPEVLSAIMTIGACAASGLAIWESPTRTTPEVIAGMQDREAICGSDKLLFIAPMMLF